MLNKNAKSREIALVLQTRHQENISILEGISAYERANCDWNFFLDDEAMSVKDPAWLFRREWDGVICRHRFPKVLEECVKRGIPCVDLEDSSHTIPGVPKVKPDNAMVGHLGAEHLMDRAFQHFGFCGFETEEWAVKRREGFVEALELCQIDCALLETPYTLHQLTPEWDIQEQEAIAAWLKALPKPIAIMACNDLRALQVLSASKQCGYGTPDEVAVLGANNESIRAQLSDPPLSSIPINAHEWGQKGAELLHKLMNGEPTAETAFIEPLPAVVRQSTEALAIDDPIVTKALKIIREEACQYLRVEEIAERVNASRSLLDRRFRKYLRRTPQEEIRRVRIHKAKQLLTDTDMTLAEIAELTGFEHTEYLSVMFKRLTKESPRDFRQRCRPKA